MVTWLNDKLLKPLNIVTTFVQNVHPSPTHNHEDGHATRQLHCQLWSGRCHAKRGAPNAAWVRQRCTPMTDTLAAGRRSISVVNWIEVGTVWRPQIRYLKVQN